MVPPSFENLSHQSLLIARWKTAQKRMGVKRDRGKTVCISTSAVLGSMQRQSITGCLITLGIQLQTQVVQRKEGEEESATQISSAPAAPRGQLSRADSS